MALFGRPKEEPKPPAPPTQTHLPTSPAPDDFPAPPSIQSPAHRTESSKTTKFNWVPPTGGPTAPLPDRTPAREAVPGPVSAPTSSSVVPRPSPIGMPTRGDDLRGLLAEATQRRASDLHLTRGMPPMLRIDGYLIPTDHPPLTREECERLVLAMLNPEQREKFDQNWELDLSVEYPDVGRFRVNLHRQRGTIEAAFRVVNDTIQPLRRLGLPAAIEDFARKTSGLVIVTGPTGSGKTTTLAAVVDQINQERQCMIITVEDPIEYLHANRRSVVKQREVTTDTKSFTTALRHVLRQDPDVIVVGEMRDLETIQTALIAAETGHLVFTTLHTPDAIQTIDRIIDVFPGPSQEQVRIQLANTLHGVVAQQLLAVPGNRGRVVAVEILVATMAVRKVIRTGKTEQLYTIIQTSWDQGMMTMDKSLKNLYTQGLITFDDAISHCRYPENFDTI